MKIGTLILNNKNASIFIVLACVSLLLTTIWFHQGKQLAIGEEGLPFYNPRYTLDAFNFGWYKSGTGHSYSTIMPRIPYWYVVAVLSTWIPGFFLEAATYFALLFSGLVGMYLCAQYFTDSKKIAFFSALFYLFNLYTVSQIWTRFIFLGYFAWAYLPLFVYTAIKFVDEGKIKNIVLFIVFSLIFSNTYGQTGYVLTLWTPVVAYIFFILWKNRISVETQISVIKKSVLLVVIWLVTSSWWLYPAVTIGAGGFNEFSNWKANFDSLQGVSQYFPTTQVLLLKQSFLFGKATHLFGYYNNWILTLVSIFVFCVGLYGLRKSEKKLLIGGIALIGWFISKGTNGLLGFYFFKVLFKFIPLTAVLRNPYEKYGLVFVFAYAICVGIGVVAINNQLSTTKQRLIGILGLILIFVILPMPLWNGTVFDSRAAVTVPKYYQDANLALSKSNNRLIQLPLVEGDGAAYTWGFIGREPSEFIFARESISKQLRFNPFDRIYKLLPQYLENNNITNILGMMNVQNIVYHRDINLKTTTVHQVSEEKIKQWEGVSSISQIGNLGIYEINKDKVLPEVTVASKVMYVNSIEAGLDTTLNKRIILADTAFIEEKNIQINSESKPKIEIIKNNSLQTSIKVSDAKEPFLLTYNTMFDKNWEAAIQGKVITKHVISNGFANGWNIDKKGNYEIVIRYTLYN